MNPSYIKYAEQFKDYIEQDEKLDRFYAQKLYPNWEKLSQAVCQSFKQHEIKKVLITQNSDSADPVVQKNLELLKHDNTLVVITGQQLGFLVSPLYVVYKTISTIRLAQKLNNDVKGYNFVPVYWLEGEDHDFEEVCKASFWDQRNNLTYVEVIESEKDTGLSMNKRKLPDDLNIINKLKEELMHTDFTSVLFEKLEQYYKNGSSWIDAFANHLTDLFAGSGLLLFNAGTKEVKALSRPFFQQIIKNNDKLLDSFRTQSILLEESGYKNQVNIQSEKMYLFLSYNSGARRSLFKDGNGSSIKDPDLNFSEAELLNILEQNPEWFSSTVLTRPLWQSWLLPTISYIGGAAEISYWAQLTQSFRTMKLEMPHLQPRHSITLLEPKTKRLLEKYTIDIKDISSHREEFIKDYFSSSQLVEVNLAFQSLEEMLSKSREELSKLVVKIDPTLTGPTNKSFDNIVSTLGKLQNRLLSQLKQKNETMINHLNAIHDSIMPNGILQERIISSLYFQNKYGPDWLKTIEDALDENFSEHSIVNL